MVSAPIPRGYHMVLALACLLHLAGDQFADLVARVHAALPSDGRFAFTVKDGDGEAWSSAKLGVPRYFCYWRADALREVLERNGFEPRITALPTTGDPFLGVIARPAARRPQ